MDTFTAAEMKEIKELAKLGFTPEQIIKLKEQTVINVEAPGLSKADIRKAAENDGVAEQPEIDAAKEARCDELAAELLPLLLEPRHLQIFDWLVKAMRKRPAEVAKEMLRNQVIVNKPAWREAQGYGGGSSKNIETLSERLTPVIVKD